jgi:hypothetical protein
MKEQNLLRRIFRTEDDWLEEVFSQSNSHGSLNLAKTAVKSFSHFCQTTLEIPDPDIEDLKEKRVKALNPSDGRQLNRKERWDIENEYFLEITKRQEPVLLQAREEVMGQYRQWFGQNSPDIQSICTSLQQFVRFCAKTAVKIKLYQNGINVFSKRISQAMKYIDQYLEKREINLEDLANAYELTPTKGLLFPDKKPNV